MTPLDTMKQAADFISDHRWAKEHDQILYALNDAITELEKAEPVAIVKQWANTAILDVTGLRGYSDLPDGTPLFTHQAPVDSKPFAWVKQSDESDVTFQKPVHEEWYQKLYAASIESKHWEITAKQLGKQLDECERERDETAKQFDSAWKIAELYKQERDELLARWNTPVVESEWQKLIKERDELAEACDEWKALALGSDASLAKVGGDK